MNDLGAERQHKITWKVIRVYNNGNILIEVSVNDDPVRRIPVSIKRDTPVEEIRDRVETMLERLSDRVDSDSWKREVSALEGEL